MASRTSTVTRREVTEEDQPTPQTTDAGRPPTQLWRTLAIVLGLFSAACAIAYPFLPVVQDTAQIQWPVGSDTRPVNAPLTGYWAQEMRVNVPCSTIKSVSAREPADALLFSTVPSARTGNGAGMQLRVQNGTLIAFSRGQQVARQQLPATGCDVQYTSTATHTTLKVAGTPLYDASGDVRARVVGIYTDITSAQDPIDGLSVAITPDTRYQSSPTGWKVGIGVFGVLSLIGCLIAVYRLDARGARRAPRWAPIGWWKLTARDLTVVGVLGAWVFIGPVTSDDGYILTMARVAGQVGYLTNYHRWFGVAEAPFGWNDHIYELMAQLSTVPPWIRLPSFLLGVISWLLISREVMPRLGTQVRNSRAAGWAAAVVFLVWWMPFNNGVRPEPWAALGSLLALCAVERTLVTRRLLPLCLGLIGAAFALAATPTALIAVAPFLVAARPLFQMLRARARESNGWLPVLAPIAAAGFIVLVVVFADQTMATVAEATRLRGQVGPNLPWYDELSRYELLFADSADGSMTRRFPVLLLILCTGTCLVVLLRRGRIQGAALGPARRLIGTTALFFLLLALTPTKWTHHFGAFAAVGSAMAALTALATSTTVLRSKRNRAAFTAGLLVVAALAATGPNAYWFVSGIGVPWFDKAPSIHGYKLSTVLLLAAAVAAVIAFVENVRAQRPGLPPPITERRGRALRLGSMSLVVVCGAVVAFEFASMGKAIQKQWGSYSLGAANVAHLFTTSCNLSDHVMVEQDPVTSVLKPVNLPTLPPQQQVSTNGALPAPEEDNSQTERGYHTDPLGDGGDPLSSPPHGYTSATVPMWSSYHDDNGPTGRLRTDWFALPADHSGDQVAVSVAAPSGKATNVSLEFGTQTPQGVRVVKTQQVLANGVGTPQKTGDIGQWTWIDQRVQIDDLPKNVTLVRVVARDDDVTDDGWVAVSAPRVPTYTTLTQRVGDAPVYMDWPAAFAYPCVNPVVSHDGISQVPAYRITAADLAQEAGIADNIGGGPLGWLEEVAAEPEVPSYLAGDPGQSWGQLFQIEPYTDGVAPHVVHGEKVEWGWWSPGPGPQQPNGSTPTH